METKHAVVALGALAQETRLDIFRLLVQAGEEGLVVGKIAEQLGVEPNGRLSFHLKELVSSGLATARPEGRFIYYAASYPTMNALLAFLTDNCCGGETCGDQPQACAPSATHSHSPDRKSPS